MVTLTDYISPCNLKANHAKLSWIGFYIADLALCRFVLPRPRRPATGDIRLHFTGQL